jgi:hypothetical protein
MIYDFHPEKHNANSCRDVDTSNTAVFAVINFCRIFNKRTKLVVVVCIEGRIHNNAKLEEEHENSLVR